MINCIPRYQMPSLKLHLSGDVRASNMIVPNFSILASVSRPLWNDRLGGFVERSEKAQTNHPDFQHDSRLGMGNYYRNENAFRDHERYNIISRAQVNRQGTRFKYYTTTYNTQADPIFHEDNSRNIDRMFDMRAQITFTPQNELYARFGIQYTAKTEVIVHMGLFLENNYRSLREHGVKPLCDPTQHNPIWWQRGYEKFIYYGYTAAQIFPKAGDLLKPEYDNKLYSITSITDEIPEFEYKWHKYFWKLYLEVAIDDGKKVSDEVKNDPNQEHFIDMLLGRNTLGNSTDVTDPNAKPETSGYSLDISNQIDEVKKDVLFRPPEVDKCVEDVTNDPSNFACGNLLGQW